MSNPKPNPSQLENNGNRVITTLKGTEKSAVLEEEEFIIPDEFRRFVPDYLANNLPSTSSSFPMPHLNNPIIRRDLSFGIPPALASMTAPSTITSLVPISLIGPSNTRSSTQSIHRAYYQRLLNMTPAELSQHAAALENRSKQLDIAQNRELQRMAALGVSLTRQPSKEQQGKSRSEK